MTDEKEILAIKEEAASGLRRDLRKERLLDDVDERIGAYLCEVSRNPGAHNLFEVLAARRFLENYDGYRMDAGKVRRFIRLYERLKFPGLDGRRSYRLTPVQVFQFANILGLYEDTPDGPRRLTLDAILFVPRKFSKTTSVAALAIAELLFGDANAQAYTGANSYAQAQICFKVIRSLARQLDPNRRAFRATREHLEWRVGNKYGKESFAECLTGGAETKDGLNASLCIMDEYAQARYVKGHSDGANLLNVLRSSMGARRDPLTVIITTASRVSDGPFSLELDSAKNVLLGEYDNPHLFAHIFAPDPWDIPHLGEPSVWRKCNPHIGVTVSERFYENEWLAAQTNAERRKEFESKLLNVFVSDTLKEWIPASRIRALSAGIDFDGLNGLPMAMGGIDLSVSDDFSAVCFCWFDRQLRKFRAVFDFFIPAETVIDHPNGELYRYWIKRGYMHEVPGAIITSEAIISCVLRRSAKLRVMAIGYDAYKSQEVVNALRVTIGRKGKDVLRAVPQTYGAFTSPVESLEMMVKRDPPGVEFDANPIVEYCFANAYLDEDRMGNKKPLKRRENQKIDGVITLLMAQWLWNNYNFPA